MEETIRLDKVSVLDFNAVGDGVADDAHAIQQALDSDARHVIVPTGTYIIRRPLRPRPNQCLEIDGVLRIADAVIQTLRQDVRPGDTEVVVTEGSAYAVDQEVTLHDEQLPIHLIDWVLHPEGEIPCHGATFQTRRVSAGHARIVTIHGNTLHLDAASFRSYRCEDKACIATQHSAILIEHDHIRICGIGMIDGNKNNQLDAQPGPLQHSGYEDNTAGCCIKVAAEHPLEGIVIEDITLQNAILHNLSLGVHNNAHFQDCVVSNSIVRGVRSLYAHDKNIAIGRCWNCQIVNNVAAFAEFEDGIVLHQVGDDHIHAAGEIQIRGNRCIGNARNGLHVGANMHNIHLDENICDANGFNLVFNGDDCTSTNDTVIGYNGHLFPLDRMRPGVLVAGRRIKIRNLQVFDSHSVALGISGESVTVEDSLIVNHPTSADRTAGTTGISISLGSACEESLYPATGLLPVILPRQDECCADGINIVRTRVTGFDTVIMIDNNARNVAYESFTKGQRRSEY